MLGAVEIAQSLRTRIAEGEWGPGIRLPTERELAERFDVARNTVRRALDDLEQEGLVTREVGRGTFVARAKAAAGLTLMERMTHASPMAVLEVRLIIEPRVTALAAIRAGAPDLTEIETALAGSLEARSVPDFETWDAALHQAICNAAHNDLLSDYCRALGEVRNQPRWQQMKERSVTAERRRLYDAQHAGIVEAIRARDPSAAEAAMQVHLRSVRDSIQPVL